MSVTVWLNVRAGDKYQSLDADLSALFAQQEALDSLAESLKITPITTFFDDTDCRYNMDEEEEFEESEDGWPASAAKWHDANAVLQSVEALQAHLAANSNSIAESDGFNQESVVEDFNTLLPDLRSAAKAGKSVHLLIVM
jgi:hypothetical protein